jgi:hypothetical protein
MAKRENGLLNQPRHKKVFFVKLTHIIFAKSFFFTNFAL